MNFEPFDTGLIVRRLEACVPDFQSIGGAADYAAVKELRGFRTPSAYVVFSDEENTGKIPPSIGVTSQEARVQFGVVLALRHYGDQRGERMADQTRRLIGLVRTALIGHKPDKGARVVGWLGGAVLDYDASVLLFADRYQIHCMLHKDEGGTC